MGCRPTGRAGAQRTASPPRVGGVLAPPCWGCFRRRGWPTAIPPAPDSCSDPNTLCRHLRPSRRIPRVTDIRVIDFGSATFEDGYHSSVVCRAAGLHPRTRAHNGMGKAPACASAERRLSANRGALLCMSSAATQATPDSYPPPFIMLCPARCPRATTARPRSSWAWAGRSPATCGALAASWWSWPRATRCSRRTRIWSTSQ